MQQLVKVCKYGSYICAVGAFVTAVTFPPAAIPLGAIAFGLQGVGYALKEYNKNQQSVVENSVTDLDSKEEQHISDEKDFEMVVELTDANPKDNLELEQHHFVDMVDPTHAHNKESLGHNFVNEVKNEEENHQRISATQP